MGTRAVLVAFLISGCGGPGSGSVVDPALEDSFRAAAITPPSVDLDGCAFGIDATGGNPALPRIVDQQIARVSPEVDHLFDQGMAVFSAAVSSYEASSREMVFGPEAYGSGSRLGVVRQSGDDAYTIEVWVGPSDDREAMTQVVDGERDGASLRLRWDGHAEAAVADALGAPHAGGRIALQSAESPSDHWVAVVLADWVAPGAAAAPVSGSVVCGSTGDATPVEYAMTSINRDLDADGLPERGGVTAARRAGVGGRAEFVGQNGRTLWPRQMSLMECWDPGGTRLLALASDQSMRVADPPGGDESLCPAPFDAPIAEVRGLPRGLGVTLVDLFARAYHGLHEALTFEARPHRVLWVGAHPDDETYYAAPVLGRLCRDLHGDCTMLIADAGEMGNCALPGGCSPDLETVRRREAVDSAALLGATLIHWDWTNGPFPGNTSDTLRRWSAVEGSEETLVDELVAVLDATDPEIVLTMDPRHGISCHAEHRMISQLLLRALARSSAAPSVYLTESNRLPSRFSDSRQLVYDATEASATTGTDTWAFIRRDSLTYPSQISTAEADSWEAVPPELRRFYFLRAEDVVPDDPTYLVCPNG